MFFKPSRRSAGPAFPLVIGASSLLLALLAVPAGAMAAASGPHVRVGSAPHRPSGSTIVGSLAASTQIAATVTLAPRDPAALATYASAVSTPGSSDYHQYLTVAEFRQRFAPTAARINALRATLTAQGLSPGPTSANGLSIPLQASAGTVAQAFSVSFQRVRLRSGRTAYSNLQAPSFSASVAATVQGVVGLNTLAQVQPLGLAKGPSRRSHASAGLGLGPNMTLTPDLASDSLDPHVVTGGPQPCTTAVNDAPSNSAYTADQLASAYQFTSLYGAGDLGAGQTIALFELERNLTSDISSYKSCYGITTTVNYVPVDGGATGSAQGSGEAALDIEDVIGLAPRATVDVYQAPNSGTGVLDEYTAIVDSDATVVSTSWGACEADTGSGFEESEETLFEEAATQGQSVFAAAGDSGSEDCNSSTNPNTALAVDDPGSQPDVTSVGGSSLTALGPPPTQTVWNDECSGSVPCGGGGGISMQWPMPSYQLDAPSSLNVINGDSSGTPCGASTGGYCREVPDVSADGDPATGYLIYFNGAWTGIGGTSAAAPLWAAFTALVNASSYCTGTGIGFANPDLYRAATAAYSADFNDITSGDNDITGTNGGLFPATTGYDMASGLGTPAGSELPQALCGGDVVVSVTKPSDQSAVAGTVASLQIHASDADSETLSYSASGLPAGLPINSSTGLISGTSTTIGTAPVTVTVQDTSGDLGTTTFNWTVTARSTATAVSCNPATAVPGTGTSCTATATDTASGTPTAPTGTVSFATSPTSDGTFSANGSCTLTATGSAGAASCALAYTPAAGTQGSQTVVAAFSGDAEHAASSSAAFALTVPAPISGPPAKVTTPALTGAAVAGKTLSCGTGNWTNAPTSYSYRWYRNGIPIAGATSASYRVRSVDGGSSLTCTVTASNADGSGKSAASRRVSVPVPKVAGCPGATGSLRGGMLGAIALGQTRRQARSGYSHSSRSATADLDVFCLTPAGVRVGYATAKLLAALPRASRSALLSRVVSVSTANPFYALSGVGVGATLAAAERALPHGTLLTVGGHRWYLAKVGSARALVEIGSGLVQQVGIANLELTRTAAADRALISAFG
jgi:Pro-kumamolisin, activation domain/Putative Ig domain